VGICDAREESEEFVIFVESRKIHKSELNLVEKRQYRLELRGNVVRLVIEMQTEVTGYIVSSRIQ